MKSVMNISWVLIFFVFAGCPKNDTDEQAVADAFYNEEFETAIQDPNLFNKKRTEVLRNSKMKLERILHTYENISYSDEHVNQVISNIKNILSDMEDGSIHDGIPRLIEAILVKPINSLDNMLVIRWVSSDYDANAIVFSSSQGTIKYFPFLMTEEKLLYKYAFIHALRGHYQIIDNIGPNTVKKIEIDKKIESVMEMLEFKIPGKACEVWIEDIDGNQSNKLPLIFLPETRRY